MRNTTWLDVGGVTLSMERSAHCRARIPTVAPRRQPRYRYAIGPR
jgi:hypothetical protein